MCFQDCAQFAAVDLVISTTKNKNFGVKGLFGSCCGHQFPLLFCDMKHGEKFVLLTDLLLFHIFKQFDFQVLLSKTHSQRTENYGQNTKQ